MANAQPSSSLLAAFVIVAATAICAIQLVAFGAFAPTNTTTLAPDAHELLVWSAPTGAATTTGYLPSLVVDQAQRLWSDWPQWKTLVETWIAIACLPLTTVICIWRPLTGGRPALNSQTLLVVIIVVANPFVAVWAVGEHHTPYLMLINAWLTTHAMTGVGNNGARDDIAVTVLAVAAFFIRVESLVLTLPMLVHWLLASDNRLRTGITVTLGAAAIAGWMYSSSMLGEAILPAAIAVMPQDVSLGQYVENVLYIGSFVVLSGAGFLVLPLVISNRPISNIVTLSLHLHWGVWTGLGLTALYVALTSTKEMMFAFGALTPYLPVLVILLLQAVPIEDDVPPPRNTKALPVFAVMVQGVISAFVYLLMTNQPSDRYGHPPRRRDGVHLEAQSLGKDHPPRLSSDEPQHASL